jgi:hypothetical protein
MMRTYSENLKLPVIQVTAKLVSILTLMIFIFQSMRSSNQEIWDRLIYLSAAIVSLYFLGQFMRKDMKNTHASSLPILGIPLLLIGVHGIEKHGTETTRGVDISGLLWLGFGPWVLLFLLGLLPFIFMIYEWIRLPKIVRYFLSVIATFLLLAMIPAAWQGGSSIIDTYHSEYVINENLAVAAGQLPYVDFIPQYGTLYSWLISPFKPILSADGLVTLSLYLMSFAAIIAVLIGIYLVYKGTNKTSLTLAIFIVVPITSIAQFPNREVFSGTIFQLLSQLPIRLLPILLTSLLLIPILLNIINQKISYWAIGFLSGVTLWLNQDFAFLGGIFSIFFILLFTKINSKKWITLIGYFIGLAIYPILVAISGKRVNSSYIGFFVTQYQSGFMAEPIITPGPVLIILPLIATIAAISTGLLLRERFSLYEIPAPLRRAVITSSFFSIWSAAGFAYYLNRSYASGQMQILFLPLAIAIGNFCYFIIQMETVSTWTAKTFFSKETWLKKKPGQPLAHLTLAIIMALPLASTVAFPQPNIEIERLTESVENHTWPKAQHSQFQKDYQNLDLSKFPSLSYFGSSGNYYELLFGLPSINVVNSPFDLTIAPIIVDHTCQKVRDSGHKFVLLNDEGLAIAQAFPNQKLCGLYSFDPKLPSRIMVLESSLG